MLDKSSLSKEAEDLVHFSYEASNKKFLLIDLEVANYKLHDSDIATRETLIEAPSVEEILE